MKFSKFVGQLDEAMAEIGEMQVVLSSSMFLILKRFGTLKS